MKPILHVHFPVVPEDEIMKQLEEKIYQLVNRPDGYQVLFTYGDNPPQLQLIR